MLKGVVSKTPTDDVRSRLQSMLRGGAPSERSQELDDLLTDGCARMLTLETERLRLSRRIGEVASQAGDADAATEMRRLWLRRRAIANELRELRGLLRQLSPRREAQPA